MLKVLRKQGFSSLVEVIVTAIIFALAAFGILTTVSILKPQGASSSRRLQAAYLGKQVIEDLRSSVDARTWNNASGPLAPGVLHNTTIGNFSINYILEDVPGLNLRKLTMNIHFPDI